jgi:hypothetical protein
LAILKNHHDGTLWYRITNPHQNLSEQSRKTAIAHWDGLHLAFEQAVPIIGVLKDAYTKRCSLNHLFDCRNPQKSADEKWMWLQLIPHGEVGWDIGEIDIRAATSGPVRAWLHAEQADVSDAALGPDYLPGEEDLREISWQQIKKRRGQQSFRNALRKRYGGRCVVTGCTVLDVLEAAHIHPYRGDNDNDPQNGLLLRADIHTLFDLNLLGIHPKSLRIELHPTISDDYGSIVEKMLRCSERRRPSFDALKERYQEFKKRVAESR